MTHTNQSIQNGTAQTGRLTGRAVARLITAALLATITSTAASAASDQPEPEFHVIPLVQYEYVSLTSQSLHSPSIGAVVMSENTQAIGLYTRRALTQPRWEGYPDVYHTIEFLLESTRGPNQWLLLFKSESDEPVYGGWDTFQAGWVYGHEWVRTPRFSLIAGGGLAVSDFGLEISDGTPWLVIPVPLIRAKYEARWFAAKFDFLTNPNLDLTFAPRRRLRLMTEVRADRFRTSRDLIFTGALAYRFFSPESATGDFAGVALGVSSEAYNYTLGRDDEQLDISYYSVFGQLDLTLLKLTAGYAFAGQEWYRETLTRDVGDGYYLAVQAMYPF